MERRRILLAVEPRVLEGALASILEQLDLDEIVQRQAEGAASRTGDFDAAIVTIGLADGVRSGVVITLPDTVGDEALGSLTVDGRTSAVDIPTYTEVIDLLDARLPAHLPRSERLQALLQGS